MNCFYNGNCKLEGTDECDESCLRRAEINFLLFSSLIPPAKQKRFTFDLSGSDSHSYDTLLKIGEDISNFVSQGKNLVIQSANTGNGKTTWAIQLMLAYFDKVWAGNGFMPRGYFIHVPTYLTKYKNFNDSAEFQEIKDNISTIDLIILDDLGAYKTSEFDNSILNSLVDQRLLNEKSIITTTNLDADNLKAAVGQRIVDRLWNSSRIVRFNSSSFRGK
jgi:DNA replication protein DnaC